MNGFQNAGGAVIVEAMVVAIQENKAYLSEVDGLIGDGDHGVNMNKGFTLCQTRIQGKGLRFTQALEELGSVLFHEIGGSMGPIYGTVFLSMAEAGASHTVVDASVFAAMLNAAVVELQDIIQAQVGDKTLMDALLPARQAFCAAQESGASFAQALASMREAAEAGKESTREQVAKFGRSSRLGERSRGVLDAGATSCCILLQAMAQAMTDLLEQEA